MKTINNVDDLSESAINKLYSFRNWADKMTGGRKRIAMWHKLEGQNTIVCNVCIYWRILPKTFEILPL